MLLPCLLLFAASNLPAQTLATASAVSGSPDAREGSLDLQTFDFSRGPIQLDGEWEFYPGRLLSPNPGRRPAGLEPLIARVPGLWTSLESKGQPLSPVGCGSYRLRLKLSPDPPLSRLALKLSDAGTAFRMYVNGREVASNGETSCEAENFRAQYRPMVTVPGNFRAENEILVHVSNFAHRKAGLWTSVLLGNESQLYVLRERAIWVDIFLTGSILIMALYHFGLFFLRRKDPSSLWFGLMCVLIILRLLVTGERLFFNLFPDFPFELGQKIEYLSIYAVVPLFSLFFRSTFPEEMGRRVTLAVLTIYGGLSLAVIALPLAIYSHTLVPYFAVSSVMLVFGLFYALPQAVYRGREGAPAAFVGFLLFAVAAVNDMLYNERIISSVLLLPAGLFAFIFAQSFMLSLRFSSAFTNVERLSGTLKEAADNLSRTNRAYSRFVPRQFLSLLNKESIRDIALGDQVQREMTVLFSDITAFTELSETMTPRENFDFLNSYLRRMHPPIDRNNGFVDKYIGDSIMALFPDDPVDAVRAAIDMQREIRLYNHHRMEQNFLPIGIRIGVHTGSLMLGTIGSETRMEGTVISDSVNVASRIEGLNRQFGTYTLLSSETIERVQASDQLPEAFEYRRLGKVRVKGKKETISVFELFNGLAPVVAEMLLETRDEFEKSLAALEAGDFGQAGNGFQSVLQKNPGDRAASIYLERAREKLTA